jgi:hypothetical protein
MPIGSTAGIAKHEYARCTDDSSGKVPASMPLHESEKDLMWERIVMKQEQPDGPHTTPAAHTPIPKYCFRVSSPNRVSRGAFRMARMVIKRTSVTMVSANALIRRTGL